MPASNLPRLQKPAGLFGGVAPDIIGYVTAPRVNRLSLPEHRTWAEVSLPVLRENFRVVEKHVGGKVTVCAVVKADAYGHGAVGCARALESAGASWLGVTNAEDALALRYAGIESRLLLLTGMWKGEEDVITSARLTPTVWDAWHLQLLEKAAKRHGLVLPVHLKMDTGMHRLGAPKEALPFLCEILTSCEHLELEGVCTHFASAEVLDAESGAQQMNCFEEGLAILHRHGFFPGLIHTANSAAMTARPETWNTMVRPGIALYGYSLPFTREHQAVDIAPLPVRPALTWKTRVLTVKEIAVGQAVGYGGTYIAHHPGRYAVLAVGYADGYQRLLSNRGRVIIRGEYAPVIGRISMDLTTVDVTKIPAVQPGDDVILIGEENGKSVDALELAGLCETVLYEILCGLSQRVPRVYV